MQYQRRCSYEPHESTVGTCHWRRRSRDRVGREIAPGVRRVDYGKREAMFGGFKTVALRDHIYQPGAESKNAAMANDMVCHCLEGELQINQGPGMDFVVKKGDVWTCAKGMPENTRNAGTAVGIMRVADLLPT
jgi:hypothetical protein